MGKAKTVGVRLEDARIGLDLVRVHRQAGWDRREGYVVGSGKKWVLLSMIDDRARPDGFSAIRRRDIRKVSRVRGTERFVRRALELDDHWPPAVAPRDIDLSSTRDVVAGLAALYPLIAVLIEKQDPDACFIGRPQEYVDDAFFLREVTPNAEWRGPHHRDWSRWCFRELTRIDVGGGYESALAKVAGEPHPF